MMPDRDCIFLAPNEAVSAIRRDFGQYPPQTALFCELYPLLMDDGTTATKAARDQGIWISRGNGRAPCLEQASEVGENLCRTIEDVSVNLDLLTKICMRVFRARARPEESTKHRGVWVETGMEGFSCHQCGQCCRMLDYRTECTPADAARWEAAGRTDILRWTAPIRKRGAVVGYSIWVRPGTRQFAETCPWLTRGDRPDRWICGIQEIKPAICRQYPGTRKHARMTGCPGIL
ncbi:MAG: YkgJ family cysteine cluster protein [Desulfobacterales bacterium]|nr:YkgJ family cysteine cluster protein [Desulfobacterales bacterium]